MFAAVGSSRKDPCVRDMTFEKGGLRDANRHHQEAGLRPGIRVHRGRGWQGVFLPSHRPRLERELRLARRRGARQLRDRAEPERPAREQDQARVATATDRSFALRPLGDYSLRESAGFIDAWHEAPSEGGRSEGHLHLAFLTDRDWVPVGVCLMQDSAAVQGTVYGDAPVEAVRQQTARILSLDVDGTGWPDVGRRDPAVGRLQKMFPGFRPVNWSNAYEATAWCLISTRISMRQGQGIKERMCRELGASVDIHGHRLYNFPAPEVLAHLMSFKGLFGRKVEYLNALGRAALAAHLDTETLRAMPADDALEHLQR